MKRKSVMPVEGKHDYTGTGWADKPGEECGVFGMYDFEGADVASTIYYGFMHCSTEARKAAVLR